MQLTHSSNNTKESEPRLLKKLGAMGLSATQDELITSIGACRALCEKRGLRYVLFAPLPTDNSPYLLLSPEAAEEFANVPTSPPYDAVVIGLHPPSFAYEPLNTAFRVLTGEPLRDAQPADRKPVLIAPHTAAYLQAPAEGPFPAGLSLGIGAYVAALETAANTQAEVVGKPTRAFFELALEKLGLQKDVEKGEVAIVGDDVKNDLGAGARELGLQRVLGKSKASRAGTDTTSKDGQVPARRRGRRSARSGARDIRRFRRCAPPGACIGRPRGCMHVTICVPVRRDSRPAGMHLCMRVHARAQWVVASDRYGLSGSGPPITAQPTCQERGARERRGVQKFRNRRLPLVSFVLVSLFRAMENAKMHASGIQ